MFKRVHEIMLVQIHPWCLFLKEKWRCGLISVTRAMVSLENVCCRFLSFLGCDGSVSLLGSLTADL